MRDVMQVLENDPNAPADLRQKSLHLAGRILEFDPDVRGGHGYAIARDILESGRALTKMNALIDAQGRQTTHYLPGPLQFEVCAERAGVVAAIDNFQLARIARLAGAPMGKGAGVDLLKKLGDPVAAGEALYRVHSEVRADFHFARALSERASGYGIEDAYDAGLPFAAES
ncbi:MAG TPA: thymidine phosphorylase, partial [Gammaproteobacteria bacterium]